MQIGDFNKTCQLLQTEKNDLNNQILHLKKKQKLKRIKNSGLFLLAIFQAGLSIIFLDFQGDEAKEIELYQERIRHLNQVEQIKCQNL